MMTTRTWNRVLISIIIVETCLLICRAKIVFKASDRSLAYFEENNPIAIALRYESPLWKFEQVVKANPEWGTYRQKYKFNEADELMPILASCAMSGYTNHIQILLKYGADADESIKWLKKNGGLDDVVRLLVEQVRIREASGTGR